VVETYYNVHEGMFHLSIILVPENRAVTEQYRKINQNSNMRWGQYLIDPWRPIITFMRPNLFCMDSINRKLTPTDQIITYHQAQFELRCPYSEFPNPIPESDKPFNISLFWIPNLQPKPTSSDIRSSAGPEQILLFKRLPEPTGKEYAANIQEAIKLSGNTQGAYAELTDKYAEYRGSASLNIKICPGRRTIYNFVSCIKSLVETEYQILKQLIVDHIQYHAYIGVDKFFIGDRTGEYEPILRPYIKTGLVEYIYAPEICRLRHMYSAKWQGIYDWDEFMVFPQPTKNSPANINYFKQYPNPCLQSINSIQLQYDAVQSSQEFQTQSKIWLEKYKANNSIKITEFDRTLILRVFEMPLTHRYPYCNTKPHHTQARKYYFRPSSLCVHYNHWPFCDPQGQYVDWTSFDEAYQMHYKNALVNRDSFIGQSIEHRPEPIEISNFMKRFMYAAKKNV
ncbi:unnamed protein product, partial [Didymodactylos carnosus]